MNKCRIVTYTKIRGHCDLSASSTELDLSLFTCARGPRRNSYNFFSFFFPELSRSTIRAVLIIIESSTQDLHSGAVISSYP